MGLKRRTDRGSRLLLLPLLALILGACRPNAHVWSAEEQAQLRALWIESLPPLPADPSNAVADDERAAELGRALYFDARLSADGQVSCATCHQPSKHFTDGKALAEGLGQTRRHAPSIVGTAYSPWLFWDGRRDSLWAQAAAPMEDAVEHGGTRLQYAHVLAEQYREPYEAIFGPLPELDDKSRFPERGGPVEDPELAAAWEGMQREDREAITRVFVNLSKSIAAYERKILHGPSRFDDYVAAVLDGDRRRAKDLFSAEEAEGLRLFIDRGQCTNCHLGPRMTNDEFHNIGLPLREGATDIEGRPREVTVAEAFDQGRDAGVILALEHEMSCLGPYSDADPEDCLELRFAKTSGDEMIGAFKVPSLRGVGQTAPYMHDGRFATLTEVLAHYNAAPPALTGHSELFPLGMRAWELAQIEAFLGTLDASVAADPEWLAPVSAEGGSRDGDGDDDDVNGNGSP